MSKSVKSVSVCIALLAASAAVTTTYAAEKESATAIKSTNIAYAALVDGRHSSAINNYSSAIESRKLSTEKLALSFLNRALAYQNSGKFKNAINDYTAAMRLDALSPKVRAVALYNRGLAHEKSGSAAMAIEDFTGALMLDPKFSQSYYSRANVLRNHGQYLLAIADYKKARYFNHSQPHLTYFGEALTYEALNQKTRSKALLLKAVALKPGFTAARTKLADLGEAGSLPAMPSALPRRTVQIAKADTSIVVNPVTDSLVTGSLSPSKADLTIRKSSLPKAVSVPKSVTPAPKLVNAAPIVKMPPLPTLASITPEKKAAEKSAPKTTVAIKLQENDTPQPEPMVTGWTVQLSSQRSSEAAWDVWKNLSNRYSRLLGGQQAAVIKAKIADRGVFYRLRVHKLDGKKQAASLCKKLKRKGTGCFVTKA